MLRPVASACAFAFGLLVAVAGCFRDSPKDAPVESVLLVTIDTLRADHLSQGGHPRVITPAIDALAARGARFEWAFSTSSYTLPSHASMMLGTYASFHTAGLSNSLYAVSPDETTLAEILRDRGLRTAAIVGNYVLRQEVGLDQGFERYDDRLPGRERVRGRPERAADDAVDRALELLSEFGGQPFFLWLHLQDAHGPYAPPQATARPPHHPGAAPPPPESGSLPIGDDNSGFRAIPRYQQFGSERAVESYRARYEREIAFLDDQLGRLFYDIEARGLLDRTLIVLTADHGEALGEDGYWFGHSHSVAIDQVHVPLVFVGPGVEAGRVVREPVSNLAIFATVLDALGIAVPETAQSQSQSQSLLATLSGRSPPPSEPFYTESLGQRGIVQGWTYLHADRRPASDFEFWQVNPTTNGFFMPLGTRALTLSGEAANPTEPPAALVAALDAFSRAADASIERLHEGVEPIASSRLGEERLEALGYAE